MEIRLYAASGARDGELHERCQDDHDDVPRPCGLGRCESDRPRHLWDVTGRHACHRRDGSHTLQRRSVQDRGGRTARRVHGTEVAGVLGDPEAGLRVTDAYGRRLRLSRLPADSAVTH
jgi:hypothetical protein